MKAKLPLILGFFLFVALSVARADVLPQPSLTVVTNATASAVAVEPDGKLVIGGGFTFANGEKRGNLARFTSEGVLDPSFSVDGFTNGPVTSLVVAGDFLYVGGSFTLVGGKPRNNVARVVRATGAVDDWTLEGRNDPGGVTQMLLSGNDLYIAGIFGRSIDVTYTTIAKINASTGKRDNNFTLSIESMYWPSSNEVDAMAIANGWLYVGGIFFASRVGGQDRASLARVNAQTGAVDPNWDPQVFGQVVGLVADGDNLYAAGNFEKVAGFSRKYLAKINGQGQLVNTFIPVLNAPPSSILMVNGGLRVIGGFSTVNGTTAGGIAILDLVSGAPVLTNPPSWKGAAQTAAQWGSTLAVVGSLTDVAGTSSSGIALLDGTTLQPNASGRMTVGSPGYILAMGKLSDGSIIIGGRFTEINQMPHSNLALLDPDGALSLAWTTGVNGPITSLLVSDEALYVSGQFTASGMTGLSNLARIDLVTRTVDPSRVPRLDSVASALHAHGGMIYAGGFFQTVNGLPMPRLVRFDATTGAVDTGWNPAPDDIVLSMASSGDYLYVGGRYRKMAGVKRLSLTRFLLPSGAVDGAFDAKLTGYALINALLLSGDALFAAGAFNDTYTVGLIKLRAGTGARVDAFVGPPNLYAQSLAMSDGMLLTGGGYVGFTGARPERIVARLDPVTGALERSFPDASHATGGVVFAIVPVSNRIYFGGIFDTFGGRPRDSVAAIDNLAAIGSPATIPVLSDATFFTLIALIGMCGLLAVGRRTGEGGRPRRPDDT